MAFTGDFSVLQGYDASSISITDTSIGSDTSITGRQIRLIKADGSILVPEGNTAGYITWALGSSSIDLTAILNRDYALHIQVDWLVPSPVNGNVYEVSKTFVFKNYGEQFDYFLTQKMAANPNIIKDTTFFSNKSKLRTCLDNAYNAVLLASDQSNAQFNLDITYTMQQNESILF